MTPLMLLFGALLGGLGAAFHLGVTRWRAELVVRGKPGLALLALPVGFLGPALAVLSASALASLSTWGVPAGILLTRYVVLSRSKVT